MSSTHTLPDPDKPLFLYWLPPVDYYLSLVESVFDRDRQTYDKIRDNVLQRLAAGELPDLDDPIHRFDLEAVEHQIKTVEELRNIFRRSYFVTPYTYLESRLMRECRRRETHSDPMLPNLSEIAGKGVQKAVLYLVKVQRLPFSRETSPEWSEIQHYDRLRNWIVHNEACLTSLDVQAGNGKKLADYIRS